MALPRQALTLDEFLRLPEEKPALEYVCGEVRRKGAPRPRHGLLQAFLVKYFDGVGMPGNVARSIPEPRCTFAGQSRVPDVAVFRWARLPRDERGGPAEEVRYPPDIVVEISSPGQTIAELTRDCEWYVANGVELALLVLTARESVRVFRRGQPWRELQGGDLIDFAPILPDARLAVREVYAALNLD